MDEDGYPTEEELEQIKAWPIKSIDCITALLEFVRERWAYPKYWTTQPADGGAIQHYVSTCGWSGNESLIEALQGNAVFWSICWVQSRRGGHYIFEVKPRDP